MKKGRPKGTLGKARVLNGKQFRNLIRNINNPELGGSHYMRNSAILATSYYLGLRAKEIAGLKLKDLFSTNNEIMTEVRITVTKGNKARIIYIPEPLKNILHEYLNNYLQHVKQESELRNALFPSQKGGHFSPNTIQTLISHLYKKCALEGCTSHTGRRSFATNLIENGADIKAVSSLMGHSSINITARYIEDNPNRLLKMVNTML